MTENEAKARVKELRNFYMDLTLYGLLNLGLILIWAIQGGGTFWPIWVIVGWGVGMVLKAMSLGMIPNLTDFLPFFDKKWEEERMKQLMKASQKQEKPVEEKTVLLEQVSVGEAQKPKVEVKERKSSGAKTPKTTEIK